MSRPRSLAYCFECKQLNPLDAFTGERPDDDRLLQNWIDRHMHGFGIETHPGGRLFSLGISNVDYSDAPEADLEREIEIVKGELSKVNMEVLAYRDELRDDASKCFVCHGRPEFPGKPCRDYHDSSKRIGRIDQAPSDLAYICTYCPYESTVTVAKRRERGDYA